MTPVERIIDLFGGLAALSRALGHNNASTVQGWKERNSVPAARIPEVIAAGKLRGVDLSYTDFFEVPAERPEEAA